jgi:1-acyl-sn-glycerol-3-phosphate acyltransferase
LHDLGDVKGAERRAHSVRGVPFHLRIVNPIRVSLFWTAFLVLQLLNSVYATLVIDLPGTLSARYHQRHYRRLWNRLLRFWGRSALAVLRIATGIVIEARGRVPDGRFIVVANHQSTLDILVLHGVMPSKNLKFIAKKELLRRIPFVSRGLRRGGYSVVDPHDPLGSLRGLTAFARDLEAWSGTAVIFPEGQRTMDGSMQPFRSAGMELLIRETGLPVLPVVIDGLWPTRSMGNFFLRLPGAHCRIVVLPTMAVQAEDPAAFAQRLEETMRAELARLRHPSGTNGER